jgi:hypothetical protein
VRGHGTRINDVLRPAVVALLLAVPLRGEDDAVTSTADAHAVVIGPQYKAGGFHRWLWGTDYRPLWTTRIQADVLDLRTFAGGLTPLFRVGGLETKGLAMKGADGRDYTFRGVDKDPADTLPEELRDTWARGVVDDQTAANHPASFLVVDELMRAAAIPRTEQRLFVMPDDPALGEFRKDFAGVVGQLYEFPGAVSDTNPGFQGATDILKHKAFYERIDADPADHADARAFLKARLFDLLIGDWDRHRDQWRWAKIPGQEAWQPIPDDRDEAFSRFEGLVLDLTRQWLPKLESYGDHYPGMKGLTWNGWDQDRRLLAGLERSVWREVATELRAQITDEVIDKAVHRMPPEYLPIDGARLAHDLKGRRDRLMEAADAFYAHLADKVDVHLTDSSEYVEVRRQAGGDTLVQVWPRGPDGAIVGQPFFKRVLHKSETQEVQIDLRGGDDLVVTEGKPNGILVRVIGGPGHAVVDDTQGGGTRFSDSTESELRRGPGSHLDRKPYTQPPPDPDSPWIPARDWGRDTYVFPWGGYGSDLGLLVGAGLDTRAFGFRQHPYSSRHVLRAAWSLGEDTFRADYRADFHFENTGLYAGWYAYASGVESSRFFGFGNETSDGGDPSSSFFDAKQEQYSLTPLVAIPVARKLTFFVGPTVKYASSKGTDQQTLINEERPYGYGNFGEVGASGLLELDTREGAERTPGGVALRTLGYPREGLHVLARGEVWPQAWDVVRTFGSVEGSASAYVTPGGSRAPTFAFRAGGEKVFGSYPYFEAAYLGGGLGGIGAAAGDEPLRGLPRHRYAGDAALWGNAELRLPVSRFRIILPGTWGLVGYGDGGRVYLEGESSNTWHYGGGAGLWFAWLDRANTISFTYARSEGRDAFYARAGFSF